MAKFAAETKVSVEASKQEIERVLTRYGASSFLSGWHENQAFVQFRIAERFVRFKMILPDRNDHQFTSRRTHIGKHVAACLKCNTARGAEESYRKLDSYLMPSAEWKLMPIPAWDKTNRARWEAKWLRAWDQRNAICAAAAQFRIDATADEWAVARLHGAGVGEPLHRAFTLRRAGLLIIGICRQGPPDFRQLPTGAITLFRENSAEVLPCGLSYDWEHIRQFAA